MVTGLTGRIIRPNYNTTLGIHVRKADRAYLNLYRFEFQYFSLERNIGMSAKDHIIVTIDYLINNFEMLINPGVIKDFSKAEWKPLKEVTYVHKNKT